MNEEVRRFDISMNDVFLMDFFKAVTNLLQNIDNLIFGKFSTFTFDIIFKILLTILKEEIKMFFSLGRFIKSKVKKRFT